MLLNRSLLRFSPRLLQKSYLHSKHCTTNSINNKVIFLRNSTIAQYSRNISSFKIQQELPVTKKNENFTINPEFVQLNRILKSSYKINTVNLNKLQREIELNRKWSEDVLVSLMKIVSETLNYDLHERLQTVHLIWTKVRRQNEPNILLAYINALRRCKSKMTNPWALLSENAAQNVEICEAMLQLIAENESIEATQEFLLEIKKNVKLTDQAHAALIASYRIHNKSIDECLEIIEKMKENGVSLTSKVLTEVMKASIEFESEEIARQRFNEYQQTVQFSTEELCDMIRTSIDQNKPNLTKDFINLIPDEERNDPRICVGLRDVCTELMSKNIDPFDAVIQHLPLPKDLVNPDSYCYFLISQMISSDKQTAEIISFCKRLIDSDRNAYALRSACGAALNIHSSHCRDLLIALSEREPLRLHYFWPLMMRTDDEIFAAIKLAKTLNVEFDVPSIENHVLRMISRSIHQPLDVMKQLFECGVKGFVVKTSLISHLLKYKRINEANLVANEIMSLVDAKYLKNSLTLAIQSANECETIAKLLNSISKKSSTKRYDLVGDVLSKTLTMNEMINGCPKIKILVNRLNESKAKLSKRNGEQMISKLSKYRGKFNNLETTIRAMIDEEAFDAEEMADNESNKLSLDELEKYVMESKAKGLNYQGEHPSRAWI